jgi:hypothetical protein
MKIYTIVIFAFILCTLYSTPISLHAQDKPIQIALVTPIQIFSENTPIKGVRLNLVYGRNISITGLDLGLVNHVTNSPSTAVQFGFIGLVESNFTGWQDNAANLTMEKCEGFQFGIVNYAGSMSGFQLGFVNYTENMNGLQIGIINIIKKGGAFPFFPIINWSF